MSHESRVREEALDKDTKRAADAQQLRRQRELDDIETVMGTEQGRRFMYRLINVLCHHDRNDFSSSGSETYYNLGERNIGRLVKGDLCEANYELFQKMERENWPFLKGDR